MPDTTIIDPARIAQAIGDPGSILPRIHTSHGDNRDETTTAWATRAVLAVISNHTPIPARSTQSTEPTQPQGQTPAEPQTSAQAAECPACDRIHFPWCDPHNTPPTAYDRALEWLINADNECHDAHDCARRILNGTTVWEEFGVRTTDGTEVWATSEDLARSWIARNSSPLQLIRRPVITLSGEAVIDV